MKDSPRTERMRSFVTDVWKLERNLVSDGFDRALDRALEELPGTIHEFTSGTEVWTWIVPEKWTRHEAYVERLTGERVLDSAQQPLHCASYSSAFEGVVTRTELLAHLEVHPLLPDAVPFGWRYYRKDWGLCCSAQQRAKLTDEQYRVVIRTEHSPGRMRVGEWSLPGTGDQEIILCAHLDHPGMANDDVSGVAAALEVFRALATWPSRRYTYRLLVVPETIGSVAWLSRHEHLIPRIAGGLFLEMLGTDCPHALQLSYLGDTAVDRCFQFAIGERDPAAWRGPFRGVIGNDERQFNAPGVRIPMLSLSRVFQRESGKWPYPEYHSDKDDDAFISYERLDGSVDLVLHMLARFEADRYVQNLFRGELFLTRFGLFVDFYKDRDGHRRLMTLLDAVDGSRTMTELASLSGTPFDDVEATVGALESAGLVRLSDEPAPTDPRPLRP